MIHSEDPLLLAPKESQGEIEALGNEGEMGLTSKTKGTNPPSTNPKSITKFVTITNKACLCPFFASLVASLAATLPAGYSAPIPIPNRNLYAASAANIPFVLPPAPYAPADNIENTTTIIVAAIIPNLRPSLSDM
jgi:hypothetical protein